MHAFLAAETRALLPTSLIKVVPHRGGDSSSLVGSCALKVAAVGRRYTYFRR